MDCVEEARIWDGEEDYVEEAQIRDGEGSGDGGGVPHCDRAFGKSPVLLMFDGEAQQLGAFVSLDPAVDMRQRFRDEGIIALKLPLSLSLLTQACDNGWLFPLTKLYMKQFCKFNYSDPRLEKMWIKRLQSMLTRLDPNI